MNVSGISSSSFYESLRKTANASPQGAQALFSSSLQQAQGPAKGPGAAHGHHHHHGGGGAKAVQGASDPTASPPTSVATSDDALVSSFLLQMK